MENNSFLLIFEPNIFQSSVDDEWTRPALASCYTLKWIGGYFGLIFVLGVTLNSVVLCTLLNKKRLRSPIDIFIIALSFADLLHALFAIPLPLTSNLACRWLYGKYLCYYEGFVAYFVGMIGLYLLTTLSLNRYWMIVTPLNTNYVTYQTVYTSVFFSIIGGFFWAIVPVFGWNHYKLEGVLTSCSIQWQDRTLNVISYNILMFIFAYTVPLSVMIYCNTKIYLKVLHVSKRKLAWNKNTTVIGESRKQTMEKRMAKTILLIIISFTIAWTPYAIVAFISSFISPDLISPLYGTLPAIFAKSSIYFNPLVYITTNSQIRSDLFCYKRKHLNSRDYTTSKEKKSRSNSR